MENKEKTLYVIVDWDDNTSTDIPISCIKKPRKEIYEVGDRVKALLPKMGVFDGVIAAIDDDRDWLISVIRGPRPIPAKKGKAANESVPIKRKLTLDGDAMAEEAKAAKIEERRRNKEQAAARLKTLEAASTALLEADRTPTKASGFPSSSPRFTDQQPRPTKSPKQPTALATTAPRTSPRRQTTSPSSSSQQPVSGFSTEAAFATLMKKPTALATTAPRTPPRRQTTSPSSSSQQPVSGFSTEAAFATLMKKVESISNKVSACYSAINSLRTCRSCAKKNLKSFEDTATSPVSSPAQGSSLSPQVLSGEIQQQAIGKMAHAEKSVTTGGEADESTCTVMENRSESDLSYVGEARFGIRLNSLKLERCNNCAKTATKLALNLIEFIVPEELVRDGLSMYGNQQHKLKAIPENIAQALKGHVFSKFPQSSKEEEARLWREVTTSINNKLKHMRKGKYMPTCKD